MTPIKHNNIKPSNTTNTPINGTINGNINTTHNQHQLDIDSINKQYKAITNVTHPITSSFPGMVCLQIYSMLCSSSSPITKTQWKSREPPDLLPPSPTNKKAIKPPLISNDKNRGIKRRATGPPPPEPAAKRPKIAPKSSQSKRKHEEPPPLVTLNEVNASDYLLGIKPTLNTIKNASNLSKYQSPVLYETALSKIANKQTECGMFERQGLNQMIHQHKVLKNKLNRLRDEHGARIEPQPEPLRPTSPWDCLLDEVCHIANNIKTTKKQKRAKHKILSLAIKQKWNEKLNKKYRTKYAQKRQHIDNLIDIEFKAPIKGTNRYKMRRRSPNIAIAKAIQKFWSQKFCKFETFKAQFTASQSSQIVSSSFLDAIINTKNS